MAVVEVAAAGDRSTAWSLTQAGSPFGPGASAPGPNASEDVTTRSTQLSNGLRVVSERMPGARSATIGFWVGVGSRDEPDGLAGVSHFLEHLLFKGTETRSARSVAESVDEVGGEMNAFTGKECTAFYTHLPADAMGLGVEILGDVLTRPALRPVDVDAERHVILEEIALDLDDPEDQSQVLSQRAFYGDHPLGREVAGSPDTVRGIDAGQVRGFFEQWYRPANLVVAAAGAVDHHQLVDQISARFGDLDKGDPPPRVPPTVPVAGEFAQKLPIEQIHLTVGTTGPDAHNPDRYAATVLNQVFGGGMSSRLFQHIREERGLAYSVYSYRGVYSDAGSVMACAGTSPENLAQVRSMIEQEFDELIANGISAHEFEIAMGYLVGSTVLGLEDPGSRMARLGSGLLTYGLVRSIDEQLARIRAITLDQVNTFAKGLGEGPRIVTMVGAGSY